MNNLHNILITQNISVLNMVLVRTQSQILSMGYSMVLFKSKIKKRLKIISRIFFFNF
jgi:hypothetical protein